MQAVITRKKNLLFSAFVVLFCFFGCLGMVVTLFFSIVVSSLF